MLGTKWDAATFQVREENNSIVLTLIKRIRSALEGEHSPSVTDRNFE